jgi:hypothetical protein
LVTTGRDEQFHDFVLAVRGVARLRRAENPDGYARPALVNALTDEHRRLWRRGPPSTPTVRLRDIVRIGHPHLHP